MARRVVKKKAAKKSKKAAKRPAKKAAKKRAVKKTARRSSAVKARKAPAKRAAKKKSVGGVRSAVSRAMSGIKRVVRAPVAAVTGAVMPESAPAPKPAGDGESGSN
jgi:hypothetical protein